MNTASTNTQQTVSAPPPPDRPDHVQSYVRAHAIVEPYLLRRGIQHRAITDRCVDLVARAMRRHGLAEGARMVEVIVVETVRHRCNQIDDELDAYQAAGGSRGRLRSDAGGTQ